MQAHEWLFVLLLSAAVLCSWAASLLSEKQEPASARFQCMKEKRVQVLVKGAVQQAGLYQIDPQMPLKELLQLAGVQPDADLRQVDLDNPVEHSRVLNIRTQKKITVYLNGAVKNPGPIKIPRGASLSALQGVALLETDADSSFLNKKRRLKEGETVTVPKQ